MPLPTAAAWAAVGAGALAFVEVWMLLARVQRPTYEIRAYVEEIHEATGHTVRNAETTRAELERMERAAAPLAQLTSAYLQSVEGAA